MTSQEVFEKMLEIAQLSQVDACKVANAIHQDSRRKVDAFASELGGYDIVAVRFSELLAGAKHEENMTDDWAATLMGVTAMTRSLGLRLRI